MTASERILQLLDEKRMTHKHSQTQTFKHWCLTPLRKYYKNRFVLGLTA